MPDYTPIPPKPGDTVIKIRSLDKKITTLLVKLDNYTYRFAGIENNE